MVLKWLNHEMNYWWKQKRKKDASFLLLLTSFHTNTLSKQNHFCSARALLCSCSGPLVLCSCSALLGLAEGRLNALWAWSSKRSCLAFSKFRFHAYFIIQISFIDPIPCQDSWYEIPSWHLDMVIGILRYLNAPMSFWSNSWPSLVKPLVWVLSVHQSGSKRNHFSLAFNSGSHSHVLWRINVPNMPHIAHMATWPKWHLNKYHANILSRPPFLHNSLKTLLWQEDVLPGSLFEYAYVTFLTSCQNLGCIVV